MMRVGKRGLNLAANAAVTAAAKVRRGWVHSRVLSSGLGDFGLCGSRLQPCFFYCLVSFLIWPKEKYPNTMVTSFSTPPLPPALLVRGGNPRARGCSPKSCGASACRT